jgi:mono/diheme cytochrome c family protein
MIAIESAVRPRTVRFILVAMLAGVWATLVSAGAPQTSASHVDAAALFKDRCDMCHAAAGAGTALGKNLQIPDLRSDKVKREPDFALVQVIREGKNNMPPFGSLDNRQIGELVSYIRTLRSKTPTLPAATSLSTPAPATAPASIFGIAVAKRDSAQEQRDWPIGGETPRTIIILPWRRSIVRT